MYFELSYTRRKALACPYSFKRLYGNGESTASQMDAQAGIVGHDLIAAYIEHLGRRHRQRDTDWLIKRFDAEMKDHHPYIREFLEAPLARFMQSYVHRREIKHLVEMEYWATADGKPLPMLPPGAPLPCDCYHGRADWIEIEYAGEKAVVHDHKLGFNRSFLQMHSQNNEQLQGYCWLYLIHHPECKTIVGAIHPWRFTSNPIYGSWSRDHLMEIMPAILKPDFDRVRALYEQYGDNDWPAEADYETVCRWCMLECPLYIGDE